MIRAVRSATVVGSLIGLIVTGACASPGSPPVAGSSPSAPAVRSASASASQAAPSPSAPLNPARAYAASAFYPPEGVTVLFGGLESFDANQTSDETWTWDGKVWTQLHPYNNPPARFGAGLVYDPAHQVLVLYGGSGLSGWLTDTWTWDGSNWQQKSPAESPPAWAFSTLAYDATRKAVILYDGAALWPLNPINQTWSWDGGSWTRIQTPTNPNGDTLNSGAVAYDAATSQTIFVGPTGTWVLGTTDWSRLSGGGGQLATDQHGFNAFAVAFDSTRGVLVEVDAYGGTWTWDGKAWTATNSTAQPSARSGAVLVDDPVRQQLVLVGGADRMTVLFDTWVWNGTTWARAV